MSIMLENIGYAYEDRFRVLDNINLEINDNESIAIIGRNGAGKTTMVKLICGLLKPTNGNIIIDDVNIKNHTTAKVAKNVGYVFQNPDDQIFHNTVYGEIAFAPKVLKFDEAKTKKVIEQAIEITQISDILNENPYELPLSVRKFVTIASVLSMDTKVIILDEPTAGQDYNGIKILENMLIELKKLGKTLITITHDMEFVANNFDNIVIMADKKILKQGTKENIFGDIELLNKSNLKQPVIASLAHKLNIKNNIIKMDDFVDFIIKNKIVHE